MIERSHYCTDMMKKQFKKNLVMTKEHELGKFDFKINFIPNGLEKYMSFDINNKLFFIDGFQFLSSLLESLVTNLSKDDFKCESII